MERLTKKVENEDRYIANNFKREKGESVLNACDNYNAKVYNKLGKIEDLLDQYNVKDLEELDKLLTMATSYEELSKQIGCPLEVIFKALKGFYYKNDVGGITQAPKPITIAFDEFSKAYYLESGDGEWTSYNNVSLSGHKNTWWLKETKEE